MAYASSFLCIFDYLSAFALNIMLQNIFGSHKCINLYMHM